MQITGVNILIGSACDMHCPYCLQTGKDIPANRPADIEVFAQLLAQRLQGVMPRRIAIWGGEPMVYWEKIKRLFKALHSASITPSEMFIITTNGQKMTEDYVEFANTHPIWTVVSSHDWSLKENQWNRIFQLKNFSISSIIHHKHLVFWDMRQKYYEFESRYARRPKLYLAFVRANDGCGKEFYLTKTDVDALCNHLLHEVFPLALMGDVWARHQCVQLYSALFKEINKGEGEKCVREDKLSVDLHGNIYACHHNYDASNICGNLSLKTIPIRKEGTLNPKRFSSSPECKGCEIFRECRGGCYLSNTHDVDCYLAKRMHGVYAVMKEVLDVTAEG